MIELKVSAIGERAGRILAAGGSATVIGLTSRGVFLVNGSGEIIFLSFERWHGPLTINLAGPEAGDDRVEAFPQGHRVTDKSDLLNQPLIRGPFSKTAPLFNNIQLKELVELRPGRILFAGARLAINASSLTGWKAELPAQEIEPGIPTRLRNAAAILLASGTFKGWNALLVEWTGGNLVREWVEPLLEINRILAELKSGLLAGDEEHAAAGIGQLLGKGEGLTPSGDDLVVGLLLAAQRYPEICPAVLTRPAWIERVIGLARQKTTWLGACLVESAAEGQADERLVIGLDGIVTGKPDAAESAARLQAYGSSSGGDALLGMALALR